jgi:L-malate glycosyltransferase
MKILIVGSAASTHIYKWVVGLQDVGISVELVSAEQPQFRFPCEVTVVPDRASLLGKCTSLPEALATLRTKFQQGRFQLLHCHYAGRYGAWGVLSRVHPLVMSIWGSDVLINPHKSIFHRAAIGTMLKKADVLQSTSQNMASKVKQLYGIDNISIVPFGIDLNRFSPSPQVPRERFRIVSIKSLKRIYGLDLLLRAISEVRKNDVIALECLIYGNGEAKADLSKLAKQLDISDIVTFMGVAKHEEIPYILTTADLAVYPSRSESFGVSALEAMACGCPVIMSDAPGHVEISEGLQYKKLFRRESISALVEEIQNTITNSAERQLAVDEALQHVRSKYNWADCLKQQKEKYAEILAKHP